MCEARINLMVALEDGHVICYLRGVCAKFGINKGNSLGDKAGPKV